MLFVEIIIMKKGTIWPKVGHSFLRQLTSRNIRTSKIFKFEVSKSLVWFFLMILQHTIWGVLEKNIRLGFRKVCVITEQFTLLLIKQKKNHKKDLENVNTNILEVPMLWTSQTTTKRKKGFWLMQQMKQKISQIILPKLF